MKTKYNSMLKLQLALQYRCLKDLTNYGFNSKEASIRFYKGIYLKNN